MDHLVGGLEHVLFSIQLGISSSQLLLTPSFFRGVGLYHQPVTPGDSNSKGDDSPNDLQVFLNIVPPPFTIGFPIDHCNLYRVSLENWIKEAAITWNHWNRHQISLWWTNIAMEHHHFQWENPL